MSHAALAQDTPAAAPAPPAATAIPQPAKEGAAKAAKPVKKAKAKAVSCDGLFEAACKEAVDSCAWSAGVAGADGAPAKASCVKVDKSAAKGTKDSCPTMFEALCKETAGCAWTPGSPAAAEGAAATPGACSFGGKGKKAAAADVKKPAAAEAKKAEPVIPPDTFGDQQ